MFGIVRARPSPDAECPNRDGAARVRGVDPTPRPGQVAVANPTGQSVDSTPTNLIRRYVFSTDHKVIGVQYFLLALFSVFLGIALSVIMRFHLSYPEAKVRLFEILWPTSASGGVMTPELYLSLM